MVETARGSCRKGKEETFTFTCTYIATSAYQELVLKYWAAGSELALQNSFAFFFRVTT